RQTERAERIFHVARVPDAPPALAAATPVETSGDPLTRSRFAGADHPGEIALLAHVRRRSAALSSRSPSAHAQQPPDFPKSSANFDFEIGHFSKRVGPWQLVRPERTDI